MLAGLLDKGNPTKMIKTFIGLGNPEMLEPMLKSVNWIKHGGDLLESAIEHKKPELIDLFIRKGADIMLPPDSIESKPDYR
jgi:hypothetical protein